MREISGLVCVARFGTPSEAPAVNILFGPGQTAPSNICSNGLLPFRLNPEAHRAVRAIRAKFGNGLTGVGVYRMVLRITDSQEEWGVIRRSNSLIVVAGNDEIGYMLFGQLSDAAPTAMNCSPLQRNGLLPFRERTAAEWACNEVARQHGGPARLAHFVLQSTRPNYK